MLGLSIVSALVNSHPLRLGLGNQFSIVTDRFHGTILHRLLALIFLFRRLRLFEYEGVTTLLVTRNIIWGGLPTQIAVNALPIGRSVIISSCRNLRLNLRPNRKEI